MAQNQPFNFSRTQTLSRQEIEVVVRTKRNLYHFLTTEVDYVLPPIEFTTMEWLSGIWRGELRVSLGITIPPLTLSDVQPLRSTEAKPCFATHIKGLRIKDLVGFAVKNGLQLYLPVPTRSGKAPKYHRAWLLTVSNATSIPNSPTLCSCATPGHMSSSSHSRGRQRRRGGRSASRRQTCMSSRSRRSQTRSPRARWCQVSPIFSH